MQLKFLPTKTNIRIKKRLIALLYLFFSIFSTNYCYAVAAGDSYGGGTVFCVSNTADTSQCEITGSGEYGLVMANKDQANFDSNDSHGVIWSEAVSLCHDYRDGGYTDWYLPSTDELDKLYDYAKENNLIGKNCLGQENNGVQCLVGGNNDNDKVYWSFESSSSGAGGKYFGPLYKGFSLSFSSPFGALFPKTSHFGVRAIRTFNNSSSSSSSFSSSLSSTSSTMTSSIYTSSYSVSGSTPSSSSSCSLSSDISEKIKQKADEKKS